MIPSLPCLRFCMQVAAMLPLQEPGRSGQPEGMAWEP